MGAGSSKQTLGERVSAGRRKLEHELTLQSERVHAMQSISPETMAVSVQNIEECFSLCSPFLEGTLLAAFGANPERVEKAVLKSTKKVLSAPISKDEWQWFQQFVQPSSLWMLRTADGSGFMFEKLMEIANGLSLDITAEMDEIYEHLQGHKEWEKVMEIESETFIDRQDHDEVGLLRDDGIRGVHDVKQQDDVKQQEDVEGEHQKLVDFIESNLAVSKLTATAKRINIEFQNVMRSVMTRYGEYKPGPIKKVERCVSKLENDYDGAAFPKAARLLDLVRCSVAFNTIKQLLAGYQGFMKYIKRSPGTMKVARIKNGFIGDVEGGYRDLKVCVVFISAMDPNLKMICEVQLILNQYLFEKKKMHKLYTLVRDEIYYRMVVDPRSRKNTYRLMGTEDNAPEIDVMALQYAPILKVADDVETGIEDAQNFKSAVHSDLGLLFIKAKEEKLQCIDMEQKKVIFETKAFKWGFHTNHWVNLHGTNYLSVQSDPNTIKFFAIKNRSTFIEDESLTMTVDGEINYSEFDRKCQSVYLLIDHQYLERREVSGKQEASMRIKLDEVVSQKLLKQMSLSPDGSLCVIGGGDNAYWYLIDIAQQKQFKVESQSLGRSCTPCFIDNASGSQSEQMVIGGIGKIEIWDVRKRESLRVIELGQKSVTSICSVGNILAVAANDKMLRLYDGVSWDMILTEQYEMNPKSLHLTADLRYITMGGKGGEECVVLGI